MAIQKPQTIHDFGRFPHQLNEVQYPAQGSPELAKQIGKFRHRGVLITCSGNKVHNLRLIDRRKLNDEYATGPWKPVKR